MWSRAARRGKGRKSSQRKLRRDDSSVISDFSGSSDGEKDPDHGDYEDEEEDDDDDPALGFKIRLQGIIHEGYAIHIRWLLGHDSVLFESFCGMLKRQMTTTSGNA